MTIAVNLKYDEYDVYIGRGSKWGNPYSHLENTLAKFKTRTRSEAIRKYESYVLSNESLLESLDELIDKRLGCFCKRKDRNIGCHGDILARLASIRKSNPDYTTREIVSEYIELYVSHHLPNELF